MKIAYFSPLSPIKSGISTYSENNLIPYLKKYADVDVFVEENIVPTNSFIKKNVPVFSYKEFNGKDYDVFLYHIGNSPYHEYIYKISLQYPGVVVLHDAFIGDLIAYLTRENPESYVEHMEYCLGKKGRKIAENALESGERPNFKYPLVKKIADSSLALIVHSDFAKKVISQECPDVIIKKINHPTPLPTTISKSKKEEFGINQNTLVISSFGYVASHKRLNVVLRSFAKFLKTNPNSKFLIIGKFLEKNYENEINELIKELKIEDNIITTDFVEDLNPYIQISDIVIQTRYPTAGETSGMTLEVLRIGKPVIVSNTGWFTELPDDISIKIDIDKNEEQSILDALSKLSSDKENISKLSSNAIKYIKDEHDPDKIGYEFFKFLSQISSKGDTEFLKNLSGQLKDIGITSKDSTYLQKFSEDLHDIYH